MKVELIDPRDSVTNDEPTYRVDVWEQWNVISTYRITGAPDVHDVIEWCDTEQHLRYVLYVEHDGVLLRLAGQVS